jgi:hypothetical protein
MEEDMLYPLLDRALADDAAGLIDRMRKARAAGPGALDPPGAATP